MPLYKQSGNALIQTVGQSPYTNSRAKPLYKQSGKALIQNTIRIYKL